MKTITTENLSRHFGNIKAVDEVSLSAESGEILGIIGANGAGKTTLIKILCGLLKPSSGTARVAGFDVKTEPGKIKQKIGYMGQSFSLFEDLTVLENIRFYGTLYGMSRKEIRERSSELMKNLHIQEQAGKLVRELPSGWKQSLAFSTALLHRPELVFLDEPTSGLDSLSRRELWNQIYLTAGTGTTLVVSTHYLDEAAYCHRLAVMDKGRIKTEGTPEAMRRLAGEGNLIHLFTQDKT